jgi:hypothetical protein
MRRRQMFGIANALLVIGLAGSLIGLMAVITPPADPTVSIRAGDRAAPTIVAPEPRLASPTRHSPGQTASDDRSGHGDARLFLRDAAAAQRHLRADSRRGETRTDLWINHPASIGSMSRPDDRPATPFVVN